MDPNAYNSNPGYNPNPNPEQYPGQVSGPSPAYPGQNPARLPPYGQGGQYGAYPPPQQPQPPQNGYQPLQPLQPNPYSGYNPNPYPGETDGEKTKTGPNKLVFIVIAVMVVVAAAGVVGYSVLSNKKPASTPATTDNKPAETNATADVIPRDDGQLNLSAKLDTASAIKEQTVKAKIKEQINLSSGFSFMATKIEAFTPNDTAVKPADGKKFVVVSAAVGNRAQTNAISISYLDFKLRDNDNKLLPGHPSTQAILGNILANPTSIKPGEQVTGRIVYEVNATDTSWVLVHKETYQKTTDNTTFTLAGEEVVSLTPAPSTPPATTPPLLHPNF